MIIKCERVVLFIFGKYFEFYHVFHVQSKYLIISSNGFAMPR